jgi:outer membrane receptor protein involved in Fe transport
MYPNPGETFSVGAFYKTFKDPIELYLEITSENPQFKFNNASKAYDLGFEVEFKKNLSSLGVSKFLRNTSVNVNAAWIKSEVDVGSGATNQARFRPLQGQSPYIINTGVYYLDEAGFSLNVAYNVFGQRIFSVGDQLFPSWWEKARNSLDLQIAKTFREKYELKFNVQNLLNAPYRIVQDSNNDNTLVNSDPIIQKYTVGTQYSLSFNVKLMSNK